MEYTFSGVNKIPVYRACDRQTDGQTSCDGIVRAMHTCRAIKRVTVFLDHSLDQLYLFVGQTPIP